MNQYTGFGGLPLAQPAVTVIVNQPVPHNKTGK